MQAVWENSSKKYRVMCGCVKCLMRKGQGTEQQYHVSSKQLGEGGVQLKIISEEQPQISCIPCEGTLEDAYIYITGKKKS